MNNYQHSQLSPFVLTKSNWQILQPSLYSARKNSSFLVSIFSVLKAPLIKVACRQESENNEKNSVSIHYGEKIKDSRVLPWAITVTLINEAFEHSSVWACFQQSILRVFLHSWCIKWSRACPVMSVSEYKSPETDLILNPGQTGI